jgi:hypothetical protein
MAEDGWTIKTAMEYLEGLAAEREKRNVDRFTHLEHNGQDLARQLRTEFKSESDSSKEAVKVALVEINQRLGGMNEFRGSLEDQSRRQMPRSEIETRLNAIHTDIDRMTKREENATGDKAGATRTWALVMAIAMLGFIALGSLVSMAAMFLHQIPK